MPKILAPQLAPGKFFKNEFTPGPTEKLSNFAVNMLVYMTVYCDCPGKFAKCVIFVFEKLHF